MVAFDSTMPPIPQHIVIKHEHDAIELSSSNDDSDNGGSRPPAAPRNLPLVDEIDLQQCLVSPSKPWAASAIQGVVIGKEQLEVICKATASSVDIATIENGSPSSHPVGHNTHLTSVNGIRACPCCKRYIQRDGDIGDDVSLQYQQQHEQSGEASEVRATPTQAQASAMSFTSLVQAAQSLMQPMAAPPLVAGDMLKEYTVTETIVQGWLYKKGTGGDFSGRRWWKPRWVTLAVSCVICYLPVMWHHMVAFSHT